MAIRREAVLRASYAWGKESFANRDLTKQIAAEIGTTENTVKVHRSRAIEKMQAKSLADLVRMVDRLKIPTEKAS